MSVNVIKGSGKKVICVQTVTNTRTHTHEYDIRTTEIINNIARRKKSYHKQINKDVGLSSLGKIVFKSSYEKLNGNSRNTVDLRLAV